MAGKPQPIEGRMAKRSRPLPCGCIIWTGPPSPKYGRPTVWHDGRNQMAYRVAYELKHGPIPVGLQLDHLCRTPMCVNPDHLEPVTDAENKRRNLPRVMPLYCKRGHELFGRNLYVTPDGRRRYCRQCQYERQTAWRVAT